VIFRRNKPVPVQYIIDTQRWSGAVSSIPQGMFPNIEKQYSPLDLGCPAIAAANNRLFDILSPFSVDFTFWLDESGAANWSYEFDTKIHRDWSPSLHDILPDLCNASKNGSGVQMRMALPYALVTDEEDTSVMVVAPHGIKYENCSFVSGEFIFTDWINYLASAWILKDQSKPAVVHLEVGKPCVSLCFNKQVQLSYVTKTTEIHNYEGQMTNLPFYRSNGSVDLFDTIKSRRPKKLLK
jgi:hypothetical protein